MSNLKTDKVTNEVDFKNLVYVREENLPTD